MARRIAMAAVAATVLAATLLGALHNPAKAGALEPGPYGTTLFRSDGVLASSPATVSQSPNINVGFVVGTDGGVWWSTASQGWLALGAPPVGLVGDPAVVSWADGRIDVFVRGGDNRLWQMWTACGGCQWSVWAKPVGDDGTLASSPSASSWGPGRIDVFVLGTDGLIYQRFWDTNSWNGTWLPRGAPAPGAGSDRPAAASWGPGRVDLFVRGNDNRLWQSFWNGAAWTGWFQPSGTEQGTLASAPSASPWGMWLLDPQNRLSVYTRGTDGRVYQTTWQGSWAPWVAVGSPQDVIVGAPGVATTRQVEPFVLGRGTDNRAYVFTPLTTRVVYTYSVGTAGAIRSDVNDFVAHVAATYADPRGWSLGDLVSFVRVPSGGDFTIWLAAPSTMSSFSPVCSSTLSCRAGRNVVINDDRWASGGLVPWPGPLDDFRTMEINHETGHWLGLKHPCMGGPCVPPGQPAPLMMQQSKGLFGDLPNWWPLPYERQLVANGRVPSASATQFAGPRPVPGDNGVDVG